MKLSNQIFTILIAATTLYACNGNDKSSTAATGADSGNTDKSTMSADTGSHSSDTSGSGMKTASSNAEQDFLNFAVPANAKEILWLKAGMAKGSKEIKQHSAMMLKDHEKLGATVKNFYSKNPQYTMPALDTANTVTINDKTGTGWDKAWTDKMMSDHNDLLDKLKKAQTDVKDSALNKIITSTIPVVESHVSMVKMIDGKMK